MAEEDELERHRKDPLFRELVEDLERQTPEQLERLADYLDNDEGETPEEDPKVPPKES